MARSGRGRRVAPRRAVRWSGYAKVSGVTFALLVTAIWLLSLPDLRRGAGQWAGADL